MCDIGNKKYYLFTEIFTSACDEWWDALLELACFLFLVDYAFFVEVDQDVVGGWCAVLDGWVVVFVAG